MLKEMVNTVLLQANHCAGVAFEVLRTRCLASVRSNATRQVVEGCRASTVHDGCKPSSIGCTRHSTSQHARNQSTPERLSIRPSTGNMSVPKYSEDLRAPVDMSVNDAPKVKVHRVEWAKVMAGEPVEINPSIGSGFKVMSVDEWADRWKTNQEFPECLACGSINTKEHAFTQTWCRGKRIWESESLCLDCHKFSWRFYKDPDFKTPEQLEKERWTELVASTGVLRSARA